MRARLRSSVGVAASAAKYGGIGRQQQVRVIGTGAAATGRRTGILAGQDAACRIATAGAPAARARMPGRIEPPRLTQRAAAFVSARNRSRYSATSIVFSDDGSLPFATIAHSGKRIYKTRDMARADVFDYIEVFYNRPRRHSHLGGPSTEDFEQAAA